MGRHRSHTQAHHSGGHQHRQHDIAGGGRQAHAQQDADDGRQDAHDENFAAGQRGDETGDPQTQTRNVNGTYDDTGDHTGNGHGHNGLGGVHTQLFQILWGELLGVGQQTDDHAQDNGQQGGALGAQAHGHQADQSHDGQEIKPALLEDLPHRGGIGVRGLHGNAVLMGVGEDGDGQGQVIHDRGHQRRQADGGVGQAGGIRHQEGHGAHDRRHDLAAVGGHRLNGTGRILVEAGLLHQRDGKGAGGDHVGGTGAVDHAHEHRGINRRLGRAAAEFAEGRKGDIHKELSRADEGQDGAEDDEQEDEVRRRAQSAAEEALAADHQVGTHPGHGHLGRGKGPGQVPADEGIHQKQQAQCGQHRTQGPVGHDQCHHHEDHGDILLEGAVEVRGGGVVVPHGDDLVGGDNSNNDKQEINGPGKLLPLHGLCQQEVGNDQCAVDHGLAGIVQGQQRGCRQQVKQGQDNGHCNTEATAEFVHAGHRFHSLTFGLVTHGYSSSLYGAMRTSPRMCVNGWV